MEVPISVGGDDGWLWQATVGSSIGDFNGRLFWWDGFRGFVKEITNFSFLFFVLLY